MSSQPGTAPKLWSADELVLVDHDTSTWYRYYMDRFSHILRPTLLVDEGRARANIQAMASKASSSDSTFRPHFKTHQSCDVGEWFRDYGVEKITVSSFSMAKYFADHGWRDITVAFPVNIREIESLRALATRVRLNILLLDEYTACAVDRSIDGAHKNLIKVWVKVDTGYGRTGIDWREPRRVAELVERIEKLPSLTFQGLLTHAGDSYHIPSIEERKRHFGKTAERLAAVREVLRENGVDTCTLSVGDTPGATAVDTFEGVDELRPGNFVYFDVQQYHLASCREEEIAAVVAVPVVAVHPERGDIVVYGGAVHLSAQAEEHPKGGPMYGYALSLNGESSFPGWGKIDPENYVRKVSQEHGVVRCSEDFIKTVRTGDLIAIIPVHSCLAVDCADFAVDLYGNPLEKGRFYV